jgi:phospholipid transport system substrate-binding protein
MSAARRGSFVIAMASSIAMNSARDACGLAAKPVGSRTAVDCRSATRLVRTGRLTRSWWRKAEQTDREIRSPQGIIGRRWRSPCAGVEIAWRIAETKNEAVDMLGIALRIALIVLTTAIALPAPVRAASDPAGFITDLGTRAIHVLTSGLSEAERENQFRALFDEGFDVPEIARFVLGPNWRTATEAQRQEFTKLFETYVVHAYSVRFGAYAGQQLKVGSARPEGDNAWLVQSQIALPNSSQPPVRVDWRVNGSSSGYKITDVSVEGVSMALTERQEFAGIIQRGGGQIDSLLKLLREKIGQG